MEPNVELNADYSEPGASAVPWADVLAVLTASEMFWLSTVRRTGRPHVTPLPAIWHEDVLHFCTGDQEQKSANLLANPACVLTTGTNRLHVGLDVIVEGTAVRVTDRDRLVRLAGLWKSKLDWDFEVGDDVFHDADGRTAWVFGVAPDKVLSFGKNPYTQTRYLFS
ncbi:pyridoxamine 5'-phosphate oxidase family protein [Actinoplanes sp. NPDC049548]|uniref:pyridoxamine 5'-phosphate oxidase family protein n=1 Tax=Actinoplanes sp. NPDC049548 TaxID=3155152 RepID=UPI00343478E7